MLSAMKTARLTLRQLAPEDAPRIARLAGVWDIASMTGRIPYPYSSDVALHWVNGLAEGEIVFGIVHDDELIGLCGFTCTPDKTAEIGYWIGKSYWSRGFATEAAEALINYGFTKGGIKKFTCAHFANNPASERVIAKLGFRPLGESTGWCEARGQDLPTRRYELRRPWMAAIKALAS